MERRDYLVDQIHELGLFIVKLVGRLQKKVDKKEEDQLFLEAKDAFTEQFSLDLEKLLFMDENGFISLMDEKLLAYDNFEKMAKVFEILGDHALEHQTTLRKELYYRKALFLLNYVDRKSQSYSVERGSRIALISSKLKY